MEHELTPQMQRGYNGHMGDVGSPDIDLGNQDRSKDTDARTSRDTTDSGKPLISNEGRQFYEGNRNGEKEPSDGTARVNSSIDGDLQKKAEHPEYPQHTTREQMVALARDIYKHTNPAEVARDAELVKAWGKILEKYLPPSDKAVFEQQFKGKLDALSQALKTDKGKAILQQRDTIADLAKGMESYFEREKLIRSEDAFRSITSFEEMMAKVADIADNDEYKPGGKYQLIEVREERDKFGRTILKEVAHPENFQRWIREKIWFYHDFNPTDNIDLFSNIYIPTAYRTISLGEILYGVDTYFRTRVPLMKELELSGEEIGQAQAEGRAEFAKKDGKEDKNQLILYDMNGKAYGVVDLREGRQTRGGGYYPVMSITGEPLYGETLDKEEWSTRGQEDPVGKKYYEFKNDILYEAWLMTKFHNYDVAYRLKGMPSEKPLSEVLAEICGTNMMTQDRDRLLRLFRMQSTDRLEEYNERDKQGSVGKAMQRALAAFYHLTEANAAVRGYRIDGPNPFKEMLRKAENGRTTLYGANEFYKSLMDQTLEKEFKDQIGGVLELVKRLNNLRIDEKPVYEDGKVVGYTSRERNDYEKVQISELAFLSKSQILQILRERCHISDDAFNKVVNDLRDEYDNGQKDANGNYKADTKKPNLARQIDSLTSVNNGGSREAFLKLLEGRHGFKLSAGYVEKFVKNQGKDWHGVESEWEGLDNFALSLFASPYEGPVTGDANVWYLINYDPRAAKIVRQAMRDSVGQVEKLNSFEAKYAEEWAFTFTYFTGISARNDPTATGHDAWSKVLNTGFYRLNQTGGKNYYGNLDNLYGIDRLGVDMWQGLKVQKEKPLPGRSSNKLDTSLYEVLTGLRETAAGSGEYVFDISEDVGTFDFQGNAMRQFYADHVSHAIDLFGDITSRREFNIDKLLVIDNLGRYRWNNEELAKIIDTTWKHLRYGLDNRGFLYDNRMYGWWLDEEMQPDGTIKRTQHFGLKPLRNLMFSKAVREMGMYHDHDERGSTFTGEGKKPGDGGKMARNVFGYLIASQLKEHVKQHGGARIYSADEVEIIVEGFMKYTVGIVEGREGEAVPLYGFLTPEEAFKILCAANAILWMMYAKEYGFSVAGGFFSGFLEMFSLIMKQVGAGIKL